MKKLWALLLVFVLAFSFVSCRATYYDESNIASLYDGEWLIGRSREEIVKKYGAFDREFISDDGEDLGAYYVNYDNRGIDPGYIHDTYFIVFDEADVAVDAYFRKTSVGG